MELKDAYTAKETASILGMGHATLERWTMTGRIGSYLIGRFRRYPKSEIIRILGWRRGEEIIRETPEVG